MNILPKKSWHVRRPENKERVRRDEENARLEEKKEQERIALAEKEARITYLRKKNNIPCVEGKDEVEEKQVVRTGDTQDNGHLNLFATEENAGSSGFKKDNEEYVKEKRDEQEKLEKRIGLLTYVGQSQLEAQNDQQKLWYLEKRKSETKPKRNKNEESESSESEVDESKKQKLDPLAVIEKHTKHSKHSKKERKKKKKRKKEKEKEKGKTHSSSSKSIEALREERLRREQKEKRRTEALLLNQGGEVTEDAKIGNDNNRYFSQFNPELARNKGKR